MDKRKRDEASSGSAIPTVAKQGGSSSQPGLTDPLPTKKPRLVSPSSVVISPVLGAPPGPKRVILKIRQPLASSTSASPAGGTPASPGLPLPATVVSTATQDTVKPVAETPEEEKKRKWKEAVAAATASAKPGETAVVNDARLSPLPSHPTKFLGHVNYTGAHSLFPQASDPESLQLFLLPPLTPADHYATLEVRIPADHLLFSSNLAVRARAVWGTEVYTDDSDIVGAVIHSGLYTPLDMPANIQEMSVSRPVTSQKEIPDHDLIVTLRVLPRLLNYQGSRRSQFASRSWGSRHDGESIKIETVTRVSRGSLLRLGRKTGVSEWLDLIKDLRRQSGGQKALQLVVN